MQASRQNAGYGQPLWTSSTAAAPPQQSGAARKVMTDDGTAEQKAEDEMLRVRLGALETQLQVVCAKLEQGHFHTLHMRLCNMEGLIWATLTEKLNETDKRIAKLEEEQRGQRQLFTAKLEETDKHLAMIDEELRAQRQLFTANLQEADKNISKLQVQGQVRQNELRRELLDMLNANLKESDQTLSEVRRQEQARQYHLRAIDEELGELRRMSTAKLNLKEADQKIAEVPVQWQAQQSQLRVELLHWFSAIGHCLKEEMRDRKHLQAQVGALLERKEPATLP